LSETVNKKPSRSKICTASFTFSVTVTADLGEIELNDLSYGSYSYKIDGGDSFQNALEPNLRFCISYWCPDCYNRDSQGCFNGQALKISASDVAESTGISTEGFVGDDVYYWETEQDAEKYAEQYLTASSCFDFKVEEED
jgi:hypothetical protein